MSTPHQPEHGHEVYEELAAGWILHSLDEAEEREFQRHLDACPACQAAVADYAAALAEMAVAVPSVDPPARLGERIRAEVALDLAPTAPHAAPSPGPSDTPARRNAAPAAVPVAGLSDLSARREEVARRRSPLRWLAVAAAVVLVALVAGNVVLFREQRDARERFSAQQAQARELARTQQTVIGMLARTDVRKAMLATPGGKDKAMVMVEPSGALHVVSNGLGRNDPGRNTYVLWRIGAGGGAQPTAAFDVTRDGMTLMDAGRLPSGATAVTGFAVSLEPGRQLPPTPSEVVAQGTVRS
ncbi:MAG: putative transrane anti-sigma factor [Actinomycetia bacterium]|jgi:hypothetical protein|nr:putative transrane anti-sigma factor [Actinomycetes bacterium]